MYELTFHLAPKLRTTMRTRHCNASLTLAFMKNCFVQPFSPLGNVIDSRIFRAFSLFYLSMQGWLYDLLNLPLALL
jgi:hypothetical protein